VLARRDLSRYNAFIMARSLKITLMIAVLCLLIGTTGFAQDAPQSNNSVEAIRSELIKARRTTNDLKEQNKRLKSKLLGFQMEVQRSEAEVKKLEHLYPHRANPDRERSAVFSDADKGLKGVTTSDPLVQEAQEIFLSGQIMDLSDEQKLKELYLYDLQFQKQELRLNLEEMGVLYQDVERKQMEEMETLQDEIRELVSREKQVYRQVMEAEKAVLSYPQIIELLKVENKRLQETIRRLKQ